MMWVLIVKHDVAERTYRHIVEDHELLCLIFVFDLCIAIEVDGIHLDRCIVSTDRVVIPIAFERAHVPVFVPLVDRGSQPNHAGLSYIREILKRFGYKGA